MLVVGQHLAGAWRTQAQREASGFEHAADIVKYVHVAQFLVAAADGAQQLLQQQIIVMAGLYWTGRRKQFELPPARLVRRAACIIMIGRERNGQCQQVFGVREPACMRASFVSCPTLHLFTRSRDSEGSPMAPTPTLPWSVKFLKRTSTWGRSTPALRES